MDRAAALTLSKAKSWRRKRDSGYLILFKISSFFRINTAFEEFLDSKHFHRHRNTRRKSGRLGFMSQANAAEQSAGSAKTVHVSRQCLYLCKDEHPSTLNEHSCPMLSPVSAHWNPATSTLSSISPRAPGAVAAFSSTETCSVSSRNRPSENENGPRLKVQGPIQVTFLAFQLRTSDLPAVTHRLIGQGGMAAFNTNENAALERRQEIHLAKRMGAWITRGMGAFPLINDE